MLKKISLFFFLFSKTQFYRHGTVTDLRTPEGKALAIKCFEAHIELVKKLVPPHQLLVFHPKDGYEPLCKFIGVPVPDEPFPHSNDRENFQKNISKIKVAFCKCCNCFFWKYVFFEKIKLKIVFFLYFFHRWWTVDCFRFNCRCWRICSQTILFRINNNFFILPQPLLQLSFFRIHNVHQTFHFTFFRR